MISPILLEVCVYMCIYTSILHISKYIYKDVTSIYYIHTIYDISTYVSPTYIYL